MQHHQGLRLKKIIDEKNFTTTRVAKILNTKRQNIQYLYSREDLTKKQLLPVLDAIGVSWEEFTGAKSSVEVDELKRQLKEMQDDRDKWKDKYIASMEENKKLEQENKKNRHITKPAASQQLKK